METIRDRIAKIENELAEIKAEIAANAKKPPFPKRGDRFMYRGKEFIALEERAGGIFAVMTHILIEGKAFDNDNCNDWKKSSLRQYMNGELLNEEFDEDDLIAFETDLISVDGNRAYGKSLDCISLLTFDDRRKHRDILPKYDDWTWTATPWWCGEEGSAYPALRTVCTLWTPLVRMSTAMPAALVSRRCPLAYSILQSSNPRRSSDYG